MTEITDRILAATIRIVTAWLEGNAIAPHVTTQSEPPLRVDRGGSGQSRLERRFALKRTSGSAAPRNPGIAHGRVATFIVAGLATNQFENDSRGHESGASFRSGQERGHRQPGTEHEGAAHVEAEPRRIMQRLVKGGQRTWWRRHQSDAFDQRHPAQQRHRHRERST